MLSPSPPEHFGRRHWGTSSLVHMDCHRATDLPHPTWNRAKETSLMQPGMERAAYLALQDPAESPEWWEISVSSPSPNVWTSLLQPLSSSFPLFLISLRIFSFTRALPDAELLGTGLELSCPQPASKQATAPCSKRHSQHSPKAEASTTGLPFCSALS